MCSVYCYVASVSFVDVSARRYEFNLPKMSLYDYIPAYEVKGKRIAETNTFFHEYFKRNLEYKFIFNSKRFITL